MVIADIGSAIATLVAAVTPPTGYSAIQVSTYKMRDKLGKLPAAITSWNGTRDIEYGFGRREGKVDYTTTVYFPKSGDIEKDDAMLQAWHDVLIDALLGQLQLDEWGTTNGVRGAYVRSVTPGEEQLGEPYYWALLVEIEVDFEHAADMSA